MVPVMVSRVAHCCNTCIYLEFSRYLPVENRTNTQRNLSVILLIKKTNTPDNKGQTQWFTYSTIGVHVYMGDVIKDFPREIMFYYGFISSNF